MRREVLVRGLSPSSDECGVFQGRICAGWYASRLTSMFVSRCVSGWVRRWASTCEQSAGYSASRLISKVDWRVSK